MHTRILIVLFSFYAAFAAAGELTVASYNAGALSEHYDYLRAVTMRKVVQERYSAEPAQMALNERIQQVALKMRFGSDPVERALAAAEWQAKMYERLAKQITASPQAPKSANAAWYHRAEAAITNYKVRPVVISDAETLEALGDHLNDLTQNGGAVTNEAVEKARALMARRIFARELKYDIICLQEADYLDESMFPENYQVLFSQGSAHSKNGVAWNSDKLELVDAPGDIGGRGFAVVLRDKESGKTLTVASGHITGCNPFYVERDQQTGINDSDKGDGELRAIIGALEEHGADIMVVGMDSNVTSLHPRLKILQDGGFKLDASNFIEATCTNPNMVLNTRIDWIAYKSAMPVSITNIPVAGVGLNSVQTNMSDHKPIAAKIAF